MQRLDTLDDPNFEPRASDIARERKEYYDRVVAWYAYQRQWLSHKDAVSAVIARYRTNYDTIKEKCIKAGVWEV
ncbi:hypothetical protein [Porphyromonas asaccharolytica]|jgi:hypothetical protein|uniref:hypothetical protein n=1 Tax=Porphyromonas asaccharolytica TaxID=28123 RepID=UPI00248ED8E0|nr:hypothetical protein [Porphyromonas asaccharolytica]